jgi:pSer/pThr/pTyr-binding forkhead associated (FHA) protein
LGKPVLAYDRPSGALADPVILRDDEVILGRQDPVAEAAAGSYVAVEHDDVSCPHVALVRKAGRWFALDLDSTNGTFVGAERVRWYRRVRHGDTIRLGSNAHVTFLYDVSHATTLTGESPTVTLADLTPRERVVLRLLVAPLLLDANAEPTTNNEICYELGRSLETVRTQLKSLYVKLEIPVGPSDKERRKRLATVGMALGVSKFTPSGDDTRP